MGRNVDALRNVLVDLKAATDAEVCAVVAKSGVPLAYILPEESHVDNFGTMAATLLGALDVIYSGLHKESPSRVVVDAGASVLIAQKVTEGAFLVAIVAAFSTKVGEAVGAAAFRAKGFLRSEDDF